MIKCQTLPQLKHFKGIFPLYFPVPFSCLLMKIASSSSRFSSWFLDRDLNVASFIEGSFYHVLISYAVNIPCSYFTVMSSRSSRSSRVDTFESYFIGNVLSTFLTTSLSFDFPPRPLIELTTSSTLRMHSPIFSSYFILRISNCPLYVSILDYLTLDSPS